MKKRVLVLALFFLCFFAFAEESSYKKGWNLCYGLNASFSFDWNYRLGVNCSVDYTWENGFGFGLGYKEYFNINNRNKSANQYYDNSYYNNSNESLSGGSYLFLKYSDYRFGVGSFMTNGMGVSSFYCTFGVTAPIWEMKKGQICIDLGAEIWTVETVEVAYEYDYNNPNNYYYSNNTDSFLDYFKCYFGIIYIWPW